MPLLCCRPWGNIVVDYYHRPSAPRRGLVTKGVYPIGSQTKPQMPWFFFEFGPHAMCFQVGESAGTLITPSLDLLLACHVISSEILLLLNMCWMRGIMGKCLNTLRGMDVPCIPSLYRGSLHFGQWVRYARSLRNSMQSFTHAWI